MYRRYNLPDREAEAQLRLGNALVLDGRAAEALAPLQRARELSEPTGNRAVMVRIFSNLIYAVPEGTDKDRLREEALELARRASDGRPLECAVLHEWGDELFLDSRFADAFVKITDAVRCFESSRLSSQAGRAYVSLGRVYRAHGRLDAALDQYARAVALQQDGSDRLAEVQSLNAISVTLFAMGRYAEAGERMEEAIAIARSVKSQRTVQFLLANSAGFSIDLGHFSDAAAALEEILAGAQTPAFESLRRGNLATAYAGLGRRDEALAMANRAIDTAANDNERLNALSTRANVNLARQELDLALVDLEEAVRLVETLRSRLVTDDYLRRGFGRSYQDLFSALIAVQLGKGQPREALATAERARARALLDLLASRRRAAPDAAPAESSPATFDEIADVARRQRSTVVAYWVGASETFVWVVHGDRTIATARIAVTASDLAVMVQNAVGGSAQSQMAAATLGAGSAGRPWRSLHRLLVEPIARHLPTRTGSRLTVVPHGPLFSLPFAALRDAGGRYLIESYEIHYVPAIAALRGSAATKPKSPVTALLVGDPGAEAARDRVTPLPPLPWADREVAAIDRMLPSRATILNGAAATEAGVRERIGGVTLLHFATHGIVQNEERLASYLALRPGDGQPGDAGDGRLTAEETYGLRLDADLIVLSGCRTAAGPINGEGVIGFTRAFLAAGASSVVATMWDVADQTSFEVMRTFYGAWTGGADKSAALRRAQLSVLQALEAGKIRVNGVPLPESPRFWAGYVLVGAP